MLYSCTVWSSSSAFTYSVRGSVPAEGSMKMAPRKTWSAGALRGNAAAASTFTVGTRPPRGPCSAACSGAMPTAMTMALAKRSLTRRRCVRPCSGSGTNTSLVLPAPRLEGSEDGSAEAATASMPPCASASPTSDRADAKPDDADVPCTAALRWSKSCMAASTAAMRAPIDARSAPF